ncbi:MAG: c-type cytochrome [Cyclobacteriaceae bacterium]
MENTLNRVRRLLRVITFLLGLVSLLFLISIAIHIIPSLSRDFSVQLTDNSDWKPNSSNQNFPIGEIGEKIEYGYDLITKTSHKIGPLASAKSEQFSGNNLSCSNCHLDAGRKIGAGSFVGITNRFPQFRGRENKIGTLAERINGCMERSMNGRKLQEDSYEMLAMIEYMKWLSTDVSPEVEKLYKGYRKIEIPSSRANSIIGKKLYQEKCQICHQENAQGLRLPGNNFTGYQYPPLAGSDTYNDGAGMARVITAAQFIKSNMPFGATYDSPLVSDEEAYHLAAYINSLTRPEKRNKEEDFPNKRLKPVSTPYGPWTDRFSAEQHKNGPFQPIIDFYKKKYNLIKTK